MGKGYEAKLLQDESTYLIIDKTRGNTETVRSSFILEELGDNKPYFFTLSISIVLHITFYFWMFMISRDQVNENVTVTMIAFFALTAFTMGCYITGLNAYQNKCTSSQKAFMIMLGMHFGVNIGTMIFWAAKPSPYVTAPILLLLINVFLFKKAREVKDRMQEIEKALEI